MTKNEKVRKEPPLAMWEQCVCEIRAEIKGHDDMGYALSLCNALENSIINFACDCYISSVAQCTTMKTWQKDEMPEIISLGNGQYAEKHYRPFNDTDELVEKWWKLNGWSNAEAKYKDDKLRMPLIWVRSKFNKDHNGCLITNFFGKYVMMNNQQCFLNRLFDEYTFLDGSPCGVEA